jgi:hypothetical protein
MRMSDEEYFRSCVAKERHLAQLLGIHNIEEFYESAGSLWHDAKKLPKWTRDWQACGPLIAEYGLTVACCDNADDKTASIVQVGTTQVHFSDHPSRDQAIRYAIVKAVIAKLEHGTQVIKCITE